MMRSRLSRWGQMPDAAQRVKTYNIHGERYTGVLGPRGGSDLQLIHLRSPAVGDTFDVSFAVPNDFSHRTQLAPDMGVANYNILLSASRVDLPVRSGVRIEAITFEAHPPVCPSLSIVGPTVNENSFNPTLGCSVRNNLAVMS